MTVTIREASPVGALTGNRQEITLITPGWGSSGYYSPAVLEQAAKDRVFPAKTQMHIDHDGEMARFEQPSGSLTRLAAGLLEDARWEPDWVDPNNPGELSGRLVAEADVFSQWRVLLTEAQEYIGASIVAGATIKKGEVDGRKGNIVESLHPHVLNRVDYVTAAGRGGRISAVLESRINRQIAEATANETRKLIQDAVREAYGEDGVWVWLRDYDETKAWFEVEDAESMHVYEQTYESTETAVSLTGERVEVRATTTYVPITSPPADPAGVTTNQEEATMATIDDAELAQLRESASRATALEAENTTLRTENGELKESGTRAQAEAIVAEAFGDIEAKATRKALVTAAVTAESFNAEALATDAKEAAAEYAVAHGAGKVHGVGTPVTAAEAKTITGSDIVAVLEGAK
jgi:hypothetical protein